MAILPKIVYNFNENSNTVIRDYSENGNDGVGTNLTISASLRVGNNAVFNSSSDGMSLGNITDLNGKTDCSIHFGIDISAGTGVGSILYKSGQISILYNHTGNSYKFSLTVASGVAIVDLAVPIKTYVDIDLLYVSDVLNVYLDGVLIDSDNTQSGVIASTSNIMLLGDDSLIGSSKFLLNEFKLYDTAITTDIITATINQQNGIYTDTFEDSEFQLGDVIFTEVNDIKFFAVVSWVGSGTDYRFLPLTSGITGAMLFRRGAHLWDATRQFGLLIDDTPQICFYDNQTKSTEIFIDSKKTLCFQKNDNTKYIYSQSDFPEVVSGVIPLKNGVNYVIRVPTITISNPLSLSNITGITSFNGGSSNITYDGPNAMFEGTFSGSFLLFNSITESGTGENEIWNIEGNGSINNVLNVNTQTFIGFKGKNVISNIGSINHEAQYTDCGTGFVIKSAGVLAINNSPFSNSVDSNSTMIVLDGTFNTVSIQFCPLTIQSGESFIQLSKNINITGSFIANGNQFDDNLGGNFYAPNITGSITLFADNGNGGTTVTSTAHGLTVEQVVEIVDTTSYNGVHQDIFNITINTFDIPVVFVANDATGTFDTGDSNSFLDDNLFTTRGNGDQIDTAEVGTMSVNTNFTTIIGSQNVPVEINGGGTDWTGVTERRFEFESSGDNNGTIRYTGDQEKEFIILGKIAYDPDGGSSILATGYVGVNGIILNGSMAVQESSRTGTLYPQTVVRLKKNDVLGLFIENNDNNQNMAIKIGTGLVVSSK